MNDPINPPIEDTKTKVGEKEYTQDELNQMVGIVDRVREIESHHGSLDKVVSDFGRRGEEIGRMKSELETLKTQRQTTTSEWTPEQKTAVKQQIVDILGGEPMTDKQLESWYQNRRSGEKLLEECEHYEGEVDGSDGRPKFDKEKILQHMADTGIRNPMKAYKDKYESELEKWKEGELSKAKGNGMFTQTGANNGAKQPAAVKVTKDNLGQLMSEALYGPQE